jgi:hypothetical protein
MGSSGSFLWGVGWRLFCPLCGQEAIARIAELVPRMLRSAPLFAA